MAVDTSVPVEKENAAIDITISMVVDDLSTILHRTVKDILPQFLQSKTCAILYDRQSKLWWDGPTAIAEMYLQETNDNQA